MADKAITVIAKIVAKEDKMEEVQTELQALIEPTRKEEGCLDYILHRHTENPAIFLFYENWASKQDLENHLQKPHLQAFAAKADTLLAEPLDVQIFQKI
ncbi:antibiotic biosynthesis monooxygenase [bacterium]|nr:antibiotic biosynthesis monooxygenase [bacterium]